jgi:hypothetical protein
MVKVPCPGGCGREVPDGNYRWNGGPERCEHCIAEARARVDRIADMYVPLLLHGLGVTGHLPTIDVGVITSTRPA